MMLTSFHEVLSHISAEVCEEFHFLVELLRVLAHCHVLLLALPVDVMHVPTEIDEIKIQIDIYIRWMNLTVNSITINSPKQKLRLI